MALDRTYRAARPQRPSVRYSKARPYGRVVELNAGGVMALARGAQLTSLSGAPHVLLSAWWLVLCWLAVT